MGIVLVVDDDEAFVKVVATILADAGLEVVPVTDAERAIEAVRRKKLDVEIVLVDQRMPYMNGMEFIRALRHQSPEALALLVTGYRGDTTSSLFMTGDRVFDYIEKPFANRGLLFRVFRALYAKRMRGEGIHLAVCPLDKFAGIPIATLNPLVERAMKERPAVLFSGVKGASGTRPSLAGSVLWCHLPFLSAEARALVKQETAGLKVEHVSWESWEDVREALRS